MEWDRWHTYILGACLALVSSQWIEMALLALIPIVAGAFLGFVRWAFVRNSVATRYEARDEARKLIEAEAAKTVEKSQNLEALFRDLMGQYGFNPPAQEPTRWPETSPSPPKTPRSSSSSSPSTASARPSAASSAVGEEAVPPPIPRTPRRLTRSSGTSARRGGRSTASTAPSRRTPSLRATSGQRCSRAANPRRKGGASTRG